MAKKRWNKHQKAGSKGGWQTYQKHGSDHMKKIGSNGGKATMKKYRRVPYGTNDFILINRETGQPAERTFNGQPFIMEGIENAEHQPTTNNLY